jgi:hypothetical protein
MKKVAEKWFIVGIAIRNHEIISIPIKIVFNAINPS